MNPWSPPRYPWRCGRVSREMKAPPQVRRSASRSPALPSRKSAVPPQPSRPLSLKMPKPRPPPALVFLAGSTLPVRAARHLPRECSPATRFPEMSAVAQARSPPTTPPMPSHARQVIGLRRRLFRPNQPRLPTSPPSRPSRRHPPSGPIFPPNLTCLRRRLLPHNQPPPPSPLLSLNQPPLPWFLPISPPSRY